MFFLTILNEQTNLIKKCRFTINYNFFDWKVDLSILSYEYAELEQSGKIGRRWPGLRWLAPFARLRYTLEHMYIGIQASRALSRDGVGESVGDSADAAHESRRRSNKTVHNARSVPRINAERGESERGGTAAQPPLACGGSLTESTALEPRHKRASTLQQARAAHFFA